MSMCKQAVLLLVLFFAGVQGVAAQSANPAVKAVKGGWFRQDFKGVGVSYLVDPLAHACYIMRRAGGVSQISCRGLKRRQEWASIITWTFAARERKIN